MKTNHIVINAAAKRVPLLPVPPRESHPALRLHRQHRTPIDCLQLVQRRLFLLQILLEERDRIGESVFFLISPSIPRSSPIRASGQASQRRFGICLRQPWTQLQYAGERNVDQRGPIVQLVGELV